MSRQLFACFCPNCKKKLFRRKVKRNKLTTCGSCKFVIENPYEVFIPKPKAKVNKQ